MTDYVIIIPTIWDYITDILHGPSFWIGLGVFCIVTIGTFKMYRKRRGWF